MKMKYFKLLFFLLLIASFVLFFIKGFESNKQAEVKFINKSYFGMIKDIKYGEGNMGDPYVKIRNSVFVFGYFEDKVRNYIKVGDSIAKDSGSTAISVFRKDSNGVWHEKVFK